jgi:hypothetical protein
MKPQAYGEHEVFAGPPTEEQDDAWDHVIDGVYTNKSLRINTDD